MKRKQAAVVFIGVLLGVFLLQGNTSVENTDASFEGVNETLHLEVADTYSERRKGLMHRWKLEENHGMLFIFEKEKNRSFWMKNTYIPLDIVFLDSKFRVVNVEEAEPNSTESYRSEKPAKYVVELNQGWAENNSIGKGSKMEVESSRLYSSSISRPFSPMKTSSSSE